jgi:GAF domain-containing protein
VVSGVQPLASLMQIGAPVAFLGQRRADAMNTATRRIVASTKRAAYVPFGEPELEPGRPFGSALSYRARADALAAVLAPMLDEHRSRGADRRRAKVDVKQWSWPGAPALLHAAADRGTPELRRLVNAAKVELSVTLAAVTFVEGDRMWFGAASADTPVAIPLGLSYDRHVPDAEALVVPDAGADPRFRSNPFIQQSHLPFYAGHPVHDRGGRMIGTFCVLAAKPRPAGSLRLDLLRKYAAQAEQELHRLESEAVGTVTA